MLSFSRYKRTVMTLTATSLISLIAMQAQTAGRASAASPNVTNTDRVDPSSFTSPAVPSVPATRTPQWHETTVPEDKHINAKVTSGVLTVDGLVAKVHLNYDIHHASYMYFFVPGVGTAVVSRVETYGSVRVPDAFHGNTLAFHVDGHNFELTSRSAIGEGRSGKSDAYVRLDTATVALDRMPMVGFGTTTHAPYVWPLSGQEAKDSQAHFVAPPPLPASILPRTIPSASAMMTTNAASDQGVKQ